MKKTKTPRMTEEEKKEKFGNNYNPNYKYKSRDKQEQSRNTRSMDVVSKNDYATYALSEQIAKDIASIPYNAIPGLNQTFKLFARVGGAQEYGVEIDWDSSHFMRLDYVRGPVTRGRNSVNSGINYAGLQTYTFIRHKNSGAKNYEPADVTIYIKAMEEVYSLVAEARRAIAFANFYEFNTRVLPKQVITGLLGLDFDDIVANVAQYRGRLNKLIVQVNQFAMPSNFDVFKRVAFVASNVFMDSDSFRGQYYAYVMKAYRVFDPTSSETGGSLQARAFTITPQRKLSVILDAIQECIDALISDTDIGTISGDILHAYEQSHLYVLQQVLETDVLVPIFDEDALAQIENMTTLQIYGSPSTAGFTSPSSAFTAAELQTLTITQENGLITWKPIITYSAGTNVIALDQYVFNSHKDNPDYKDNLEWTRLMNTGSFTSTTDLALASSGLEIIVGAFIADVQVAAEGGQLEYKYDTYFRQAVVVATSGTTYALTFADVEMENFDWHPIQYLVKGTSSPFAITDLRVRGDLKKYTVIEVGTISNINESANAAAYFGKDLGYGKTPS